MGRLNQIYKISLWGGFAVLLILYFISSFEKAITYNRIPFLLYTIMISVLYLFIYRRKNIFCYETFFLLLFIISAFFYDIVINNMIDTSSVIAAYYNADFSRRVENKGVIINTISLVVFLMAATRINEQTPRTIVGSFIIDRNFSLSINILSVICGLYIAYLGGTGIISSWFRYSNVISEYTNTHIVYLTIIFLVLTALEFSRLSVRKCSNFRDFLKFVNKIYLGETICLVLLLLISGNRNECLLILLPMIVSYHIFIKPFNNKQFLLLLLVGILTMVMVGLTRQSGTLSSLKEESINLYDITRDFGFVDKNTKYMIEYTDKNSPIGFKNALLTIFSSIPFLGGLFVAATGVSSDLRSTELTTQGMQMSYNMDSGLGTSLLGDLYYTGGFLFTLLFMYFLGWLMAKLNMQFTVQKRYNIWSLIVYLFMFSNVVYYIRAEWTMPFRYIGFSFIILLVLSIFQPRKKYIR